MDSHFSGNVVSTIIQIYSVTIESSLLLSKISVLHVQEEIANAETKQRVKLTLLKKTVSQIPLICSSML